MKRDSETRPERAPRDDDATRAGAPFDGEHGRDGALAAAATLASVVPGLRLLTGLAIATILIAALYFGRSLLIPLALAALLGFLLDPPVRLLCRWGLPRTLSVFFVVLLAVGALVGVGAYVTNQLTALSGDLPTYQSTIRSKLHVLREAATRPGAWEGALKTLQTVQKEIDTAPKAGQAASVQRVEIVGPESRPTRVVLDWLGRVSEPVATAGIALLFVILMLMDRRDLRDRLLRLAGGDLHVATDAMDEASGRIGRYLRMQFLINACYAVPMGLGLWWIGVPAAALWGFVAAVMRFVPYVGPIVSAVFPIALAFAVSPDWGMVLWTIGLIVALEVVCGNLVEPWLYGSSTGLSAMSIIVAAMFWTALWGPLGLILSTPLTVCLLVIGRYLPSLHFLEVLLGSASALAPPQRLYQRLLAGDVEEALDLADEVIAERASKNGADTTADALARFYGEVAVPMLRIATAHHADAASAEHRLRLSTGAAELVEELREQYPPLPVVQEEAACVLCLGARWEVDVLAAAMVAHALELRGRDARAATQAILSAPAFDVPADCPRPEVICLSVFGTQPQARVRLIVRRLRRRLPDVRVVVAAWNSSAAMFEEDMPRRLDVEAIVSDLGSLALHVDHLLSDADGIGATPVPPDDAARVEALQRSGALSPTHEALYEETIRRATNAFDAKYAEISWVDAERVRKPASALAGAGDGVPRESSVCAHVVGGDADVVVADLARDPRFAGSALLREYGIRFYAGTPIRDRDGRALGALCIMDSAPREMKPAEMELLAEMAAELMRRVHERATDAAAG
ncbi:AI-2E family transporter [Dokdonella sp.]|uniref:AI-2E family transporter n=1 Tax=Dokdonella sp. TaxID=2291710 RepID=UPI001B09982F|nr:AI-2E family transporter [Dokdonella sp.]MBO9663058.1 AI-2E family transporter [Dokdonella sp.]